MTTPPYFVRHSRWALAAVAAGCLLGVTAVPALAAPRPLLATRAAVSGAHVAPAIWDGNAWAGWQAAGGEIASQPAVVSWSSGRLDLFARGTDGALVHRWFDGGQWSGWENQGGALRGAPAAVAWGANRLDVFIRGTDNALWHKWWDGSAWSAWESQGGILSADPAGVAWAPNRLDVAIRGADAAAWHKWWNGSAWSGWEWQGGTFSSGPTIASWTANRLDMFARGTDNALWHRWWDGTSWSYWEWQGGALTSSPAAVSWAANRIDVFVRSTDSAIWHKWWDGASWSTWEPRGGTFTSAPSVASTGANEVDVFARGTDLKLWHQRWDGGSWSPWTALGAAATSNVINDVAYYRQVYELSCEEASLQMGLTHEDIAVSQNQVLNDIGIDWRSAYRDANGLRWGDPYTNFVGDPNGSEVLMTGYGTYLSTISRVTSGYAGTVVWASEGTSAQDVYSSVLQSHPTVVWVSFDWAYHGPGSYLAFDGRWVQYEGPVEHAVTLVGVSPSSVYVYNPWYGPQWISKATFEAAYHTYHDMAVVLQ